MQMLWGWLLAVVTLVLGIVSLLAFQRSTTTIGKIIVGVVALLLGVTGLCSSPGW
jgi:hypothetical protein